MPLSRHEPMPTLKFGHGISEAAGFRERYARTFGYNFPSTTLILVSDKTINVVRLNANIPTEYHP
jgi:hypothetical protein